METPLFIMIYDFFCNLFGVGTDILSSSGAAIYDTQINTICVYGGVFGVLFTVYGLYRLVKGLCLLFSRGV